MTILYSKKNGHTQQNTENNAIFVRDFSSQTKSLQRKADMANNAAQREETPRPNNTGMPDNLKAGIESLSGFSMDDVRVHYNSSKPATVQALAYTQGTDIHVAPGQEKHLPHEAWHVAQQMAGRVSPTTNINGMPVNDNAALEHEADVMGEKATIQKKNNEKKMSYSPLTKITQCEFDEHSITTYTQNKENWTEKMRMIESTSPSTYVHASRDGDSKFTSKNLSKTFNNVNYIGGDLASRTTATNPTEKDQINKTNNGHITLEGRYMYLMNQLVHDAFSLQLDAIKKGPPVISGYDNLNFSDYNEKKIQISPYSIQQIIENIAEDAEDFIRTNKNDTDDMDYPISIIKHVSEDTLNYTNHLIDSIPYLKDADKNNNLVHYHGGPWPKIRS